MRAVASIGGIQLPWHFGQSGQPSPEPVERTTAPVVITATAADVVAIEIL